MKLAILDDCFDTLRTLPCFTKLDGFVAQISLGLACPLPQTDLA